MQDFKIFCIFKISLAWKSYLKWLFRGNPSKNFSKQRQNFLDSTISILNRNLQHYSRWFSSSSCTLGGEEECDPDCDGLALPPPPPNQPLRLSICFQFCAPPVFGAADSSEEVSFSRSLRPTWLSVTMNSLYSPPFLRYMDTISEKGSAARPSLVRMSWKLKPRARANCFQLSPTVMSCMS